ncbi:methylase of polypeptide subunit release factors [Microbacterium sp. SORGH_AS 862]|nr:methylase of polypeptide subunit release factors [Microbacterium sp. SORGH_AS_0862]
MRRIRRVGSESTGPGLGFTERTPGLNGLMHTAIAHRLADDLHAAGFTTAVLQSFIGVAAESALTRAVAVPARRVLARHPHEAVAVLARLFVLGDAVDAASVAAALPMTGLEDAERLGVIERRGQRVVPAVALRPHVFADGGDGWIASDLDELAGVFPLRADHVLGVGGAGRTLVSLLPATGNGRALDLGCGCGLVAFELRRRGFEVVATDISPRALWFTRLGSALNRLEGIDVREGSLYEPVGDERFELIASNPPFVITPRVAGVPAYEYRDGGRAGDELMREVVAGAASHLVDGGRAIMLGNWEDPDGLAGLERVRAWTEGVGAWVIEREQLDPARYAELWVRDGGTRPGSDEHEALIGAWLDDFETRGVAGVGLGWVQLMRGSGLRRFERVAQGVDTAVLAAHTAAVWRAAAWLDRTDDMVLAASVLRVAADVTEARHHLPGAEAPSVIELRQGGGLARTVSADPALAALVGASDGELPVGVLIDAIADLLEVDAGALRTDLLPKVRELVLTGMLEVPHRAAD